MNTYIRETCGRVVCAGYLWTLSRARSAELRSNGTLVRPRQSYMNHGMLLVSELGSQCGKRHCWDAGLGIRHPKHSGLIYPNFLSCYVK